MGKKKNPHPLPTSEIANILAAAGDNPVRCRRQGKFAHAVVLVRLDKSVEDDQDVIIFTLGHVNSARAYSAKEILEQIRSCQKLRTELLLPNGTLTEVTKAERYKHSVTLFYVE